jgi:hypothetical protein
MLTKTLTLPDAISLPKTLSLTDLTLFGITSILGSGGFNLIGNALAEGGYNSLLTLGGSGALFLGSAYSYSYAREKYNSNTSETKIIESTFGSIGKNISIFSILFYNIFAIATILVFCSKLLFPEKSSFQQISFAGLLLGLMTLAAFQKLEFNKEIINIFSIGIVLLLSIIGFVGTRELFSEGYKGATVPNYKLNLHESFLLFFFVLGGHDALIKFTEEAKNASDVDTATYYSVIISILLTLGVCLACLYYIDFKNDAIENALAIIFDRGILNGSGKYITGLSLIFMVVTTFLGYLATTRYLYTLPEDIKVLEFIRKDGFSGNVSAISILLVTLFAGLAILINSTISLVEYTDIALIIVLLLVSSATFIDKYKNSTVSVIDGASSIGFLSILILTIQKHF